MRDCHISHWGNKYAPHSRLRNSLVSTCASKCRLLTSREEFWRAKAVHLSLPHFARSAYLSQAASRRAESDEWTRTGKGIPHDEHMEVSAKMQPDSKSTPSGLRERAAVDGV